MAKYYVVSRNDDKYDLIKVGHKVKLEDIDKYTLNFNNKEELIEDINSNGNNISSDSDLFIVYKNKGKISTKEILYKGERNYNILDNINKSLNGEDLDYRKVFDETFKLSRRIEFSEMLISSVYPIYKGFIDMVFRSHKDVNQIRFNKDNSWLKNSYNNLRDLCILMDDYDSLQGKRSFLLLSKKIDLARERKVIYDDLNQTIDSGFGQISMFGGPDNYINITGINVSKIPSSHVFKGGKPGNITPKEVSSNIEVTTPPTMTLSVDTKPYKLDMKSIEKINLCYQNRNVKQEAIRGILKFLTSDYYMPEDAIKIMGNSYYIDFDVFGYKYSLEEKNELSSLLSQNMMKNIKGYKDCTKRMKGPYLHPEVVREYEEDRQAYRSDIKHYLERYAEKNSKSLNKIYRFCQVQRDVIDNTKGKSR